MISPPSAGAARARAGTDQDPPKWIAASLALAGEIERAAARVAKLIVALG